MKEKIKKKLKENIERILNKEELSYEDTKLLKAELYDLEKAENREENEEKMKALVNGMFSSGFGG
jgi:hypothetical protein